MDFARQEAQAQQQAQQAQQQGQQAAQGYRQQANQYGQQYNQYQQQTQANQQQQQQYSQYLQGAGAGQNLYSTALGQAQQQYGFDPRSLATATQNLTQQQNAQAALQAASQSSTGGYGLSGAQLGNMYSSQAAPLQAQVGAQSNVVGNLTNLANLAQTQANAQAGAGLQTEQTTAKALADQVTEAQSNMESAAQQMQAYENLYQQQGTLTAQQVAAYQNLAIGYKNAQSTAQTAAAQAAQLYAQAKFYTAGGGGAVGITPTASTPKGITSAPPSTGNNMLGQIGNYFNPLTSPISVLNPNSVIDKGIGGILGGIGKAVGGVGNTIAQGLRGL